MPPVSRSGQCYGVSGLLSGGSLRLLSGPGRHGDLTRRRGRDRNRRPLPGPGPAKLSAEIGKKKESRSVTGPVTDLVTFFVFSPRKGMSPCGMVA